MTITDAAGKIKELLDFIAENARNTCAEHAEAISRLEVLDSDIDDLIDDLRISEEEEDDDFFEDDEDDDDPFGDDDEDDDDESWRGDDDDDDDL